MKTNITGFMLVMDWPKKIQRRGSNEKQKPAKKPSGSPKTLPVIPSSVTEPFTLKIRIESPPLVAFGPPEDSTGALLSGILELCPRKPANGSTETTIDIAKLEMRFLMEVSTRRPIGHNCPACTTRSKVLHTWTLIPSRKTLNYNNGTPYSFPFSFLVPGHSPATTRSSLATVSYKLVAEAIPVPPSLNRTSSSGLDRPISSRQTDSFKPVVLSQPIKLSRSILPDVEPKNSHRIFPPTTLSTILTLPTVIYPGTMDNAVDVTISGFNIITHKLRWSLRKISWRMDELAKVVSPACPAHCDKVGGTEGKGILYEDRRTVGAGEMKSGWKYDPSAGKIEAVLHIGTHPKSLSCMSCRCYFRGSCFPQFDIGMCCCGRITSCRSWTCEAWRTVGSYGESKGVKNGISYCCNGKRWDGDFLG